MNASLRPILIVEDNEHDLELTLTALEAAKVGNRIVVARDGTEALDYLFRRGAHAGRAKEHPSVVLLDIKMPRMDGLEVLRTMKADPALRVIPVVMLTSSREEQDLVLSYELGVNAYVVKPVDFQQFLDSVRQVGCFWAVVNEPVPYSRTDAP